MSILADIVTAPARAWTAAVEAVTKAEPKPRPIVVKKPKKPKKPKVLRPAIVASGADALTLTNSDGQTSRFNSIEKIITEQKLNEVLQPMTQRFNEFEHEFDEVEKDLDKNDDTTNQLVEEVNELQEENKKQHAAIQNLLDTTGGIAKELAEGALGTDVPEKTGVDPMFLLSRRKSGSGGLDPMAFLLMGNGGGMGSLSEVPLVRTKDGSLVVDAVKIMVTLDILGGLGIFGPTKELKAAREEGNQMEVAKLSKLVAEELQGFVDASVHKAVEAALA